MTQNPESTSVLLRDSKQRHDYYECVLTGRTMADVARKHGVSREAIRQRVNRYAKRHGLPKLNTLNRLGIDDNGRKCSNCGEWFPWNNFHASVRSWTRHQSMCKVCHKSYKDPNIALAPNVPLTILQRFEKKYEVVSDGCWIWIGAIAGDQYPRFHVSTSQGTVPAYRWSYGWFVGTIPAGESIVRLCLNRLCVNPEHLTSVSQPELRARSKDPVEGLEV